jgi:calmodulin
MNQPSRAEAHSTFIDPAITPEADRAQLRSSNPAKYVVGSVLSLGDDPRNVKYSGWYVHETGHDEGASGPGFVLIRPNPPGAGDDADAGDEPAALTSRYEFPSVVGRPFAPEELEDFRDTFAEFDVDQSGAIDAEELGSLLKRIGEDAEPERIAMMMKEVDKDGNGEIDFAEFLGVVTKVLPLVNGGRQAVRYRLPNLRKGVRSLAHACFAAVSVSGTRDTRVMRPF